MIKVEIEPNCIFKSQFVNLAFCIKNTSSNPYRDLYIEFTTSSKIMVVRGGRAIRIGILKANQHAIREVTMIAKESGEFWLENTPSSYYWNFEGIQKLEFCCTLQVVDEKAEITNNTKYTEFDHAKIVKLCSMIEMSFNLSELSQLCFRLDIDFENLAGTTKENKSRELVNFCQRANTLQFLIEQCHVLRPNVNWLV